MRRVQLQQEMMAREVPIIGEPQVRRRPATNKKRRMLVELKAGTLMRSGKHLECDLHFQNLGRNPGSRRKRRRCDRRWPRLLTWSRRDRQVSLSRTWTEPDESSKGR